MSAKVKHIHLPFTTYKLCKKDGGVNSSKTYANCKTCLKLYKRHREMIRELSEYDCKLGNNGANQILIKHGFI